MLRDRGLIVNEYDENLKKQHKIATYVFEQWPKLLWAPETDDEYLSQIVDWTAESKNHDDAPDSLASLCRQCFSTKGARSERWKL